MGLETASITVAQRIATGLDRFTLLAIPFFILSGQLMKPRRQRAATRRSGARARRDAPGRTSLS